MHPAWKQHQFKYNNLSYKKSYIIVYTVNFSPFLLNESATAFSIRFNAIPSAMKMSPLISYLGQSVWKFLPHSKGTNERPLFQI